jgi:hypothetical protein
MSVLFALALGGLAEQAVAAASARAILSASGVGAIKFGGPKAETVRQLSALFGAPNWRGINSGCGARWTEALWDGGLAAEFRGNTFTGYRYASASHIEGMFGAPHMPSSPGFPRLTTATGIALGSTLAQVRAAYRVLRFVGTDRHKTPNGIVFVDNARRSPASLSSRIVEIKTANTCGDF